MDSQCDKLVMVVSHQFITLTVDICVQHGERLRHHVAQVCQRQWRLVCIVCTAVDKISVIVEHLKSKASSSALTCCLPVILSDKTSALLHGNEICKDSVVCQQVDEYCEIEIYLTSCGCLQLHTR